jgi:putative exosortase-associated protein (TIGR04073 family)
VLTKKTFFPSPLQIWLQEPCYHDLFYFNLIVFTGSPMKGTFVSSLVLFILFTFTPQLVLADNYPANALGKLTNGVANVAFGFGEIPKTIFISSLSEGPAYGATAGILMGMMQMVARTLNGAFDVATFIVPTKPFVTPEYIWNDFCKETSYSSNLQLR